MLKPLLKGAGLLPAARRLRHWLALSRDPDLRRRERLRGREFAEFRRRYGPALASPLGRGDGRRALVVSAGSPAALPVELSLIKALELAGFSPTVLSPVDPWLVRHYRLAPVAGIVHWEDVDPVPDLARATAITRGLGGLPDLLALEHAGARVGRFTASTALRRLRVGVLDLADAATGTQVAEFLAASMAAAEAAGRLVARVRPALVLFVDRGYTPEGELFDRVLGDEGDVITWNAAHKNNAIILKRYRAENRDEHPASLSAATWEWARDMAWTPEQRQRLHDELRACYASGEWYSEVGTQRNTELVTPDETRRRLGLRAGRKTAAIFPHILWDGTFFYGRDLFGSYESWLVESVRAACANPAVDWVIKVHPANRVKSVRDGVPGEASEARVIRERLGRLPEHVRLIPAESDVSTYSLYSVIDYGVTVRGTVGIEAASLGLPVFTAGTGRYDGKGFTIDSHSPAEYLERLAHIEQTPPLDPARRELAERFAYAIFVLRPLALESVTLEYGGDARATLTTRITVESAEGWRRARDLRALADWLGDAKPLDFLAAAPASRGQG
jgi:hypothetical protein